MMHLCVYLYGCQLRVVRSASEDTVALAEPILGFIHKMIYSISDLQNSGCILKM